MQLFYQSNPNVCSFDMNHIISFRNFSFGMVISHENKVNNTKLNLVFALLIVYDNIFVYQMDAWLFYFFFFLTYNGSFETFAEVYDDFLHVNCIGNLHTQKIKMPSMTFESFI